jgi:hypothetical protein
MYLLTTADESTLNKSTFNVSANVSAAFFRRRAVEPDRTRTTEDGSKDGGFFFARCAGFAFFCAAARVPRRPITFPAISVSPSLGPGIAPILTFANFPKHACGALRILSSIDHND